MTNDPKSAELSAAAERTVEQWDNHDRHRITEAESAFLIDGAPPEVHWAHAYLATVAADEAVIKLLSDAHESLLSLLTTFVPDTDGAYQKTINTMARIRHHLDFIALQPIAQETK